MRNSQAEAAEVDQPDRIVLFDGVCRLCSAWAKFLIRFDRRHRFKLATVQSPEGQAILARHGFPQDHFDTMLLVEGPAIHTKSAAFLRVMRRLPFPWPLACIAWIIPWFVRDWMYDRVALNRYALFGRLDSCLVPHEDHENRFFKAHD
ncbi:thiol-disulfide oxidoreductase DCC family protein [Dokdonella sp.]|uniref:thiol-disulfide oxidoreductase DCC family protein n=1 Tax=Dokdonella sp. TaxID=2291710 RepID=UPI0035290F95